MLVLLIHSTYLWYPTLGYVKVLYKVNLSDKIYIKTGQVSATYIHYAELWLNLGVDIRADDLFPVGSFTLDSCGDFARVVFLFLTTNPPFYPLKG